MTLFKIKWQNLLNVFAHLADYYELTPEYSTFEASREALLRVEDRINSKLLSDSNPESVPFHFVKLITQFQQKIDKKGAIEIFLKKSKDNMPLLMLGMVPFTGITNTGQNHLIKLLLKKDFSLPAFLKKWEVLANSPDLFLKEEYPTFLGLRRIGSEICSPLTPMRREDRENLVTIIWNEIETTGNPAQKRLLQERFKIIANSLFSSQDSQGENGLSILNILKKTGSFTSAFTKNTAKGVLLSVALCGTAHLTHKGISLITSGFKKIFHKNPAVTVILPNPISNNQEIQTNITANKKVVLDIPFDITSTQGESSQITSFKDSSIQNIERAPLSAETTSKNDQILNKYLKVAQLAASFVKGFLIQNKYAIVVVTGGTIAIYCYYNWKSSKSK